MTFPLIWLSNLNVWNWSLGNVKKQQLCKSSSQQHRKKTTNKEMNTKQHYNGTIDKKRKTVNAICFFCFALFCTVSMYMCVHVHARESVFECFDRPMSFFEYLKLPKIMNSKVWILQNLCKRKAKWRKDDQLMRKEKLLLNIA